MPNERLIVPTHPKRITDLTGCRRSSLDTTVKSVSHNNHLVVPLMSSTNINDPLHHHHHHHHHGVSSGGGTYNGVNQGLNRIDPVAISLAAKAKRQQQQQVHQQQQQQQRPTVLGSPSPKEQPPLSQININRRGSLDANVEYAVAMVNIVNPIYDMDDRDMCPFGTRRDSVCGNTNNNTNGMNKTNDSPKRPRRRILKKGIAEEQNNQINILNDGNHIVTCYNNNMDGISAITAVTTMAPTHRPMTKIATISQTDDYNLVRKHSNKNNNNNNSSKNRPLTLSERIHFH